VDRLVVLGSVIVDVVMFVPGLPPRGGDVLATDGGLATGGGFNVLSAAVRQGLPAALAGRHGTGPFADLARGDLAAVGVELLLPRTPGGDTGFCVGLIEADERTYATHPGVEGSLTAAELAAVGVRPSDAVYLSGYDLAYPHGDVVAGWFAALPEPVVTIFDPGPLVAELPPGLLRSVLGRADWLSANLREARLMTDAHAATGPHATGPHATGPHATGPHATGPHATGTHATGPHATGTHAAGADAAGADAAGAGAGADNAGADNARGAAEVAARLLAARHAPRAGVVVRDGGEGCVVAVDGRVTRVPVPGGPVTPVDTSGAGDAHVGAFAAALARGLPPEEAGRWANAAAARCVLARGPATAPTLDVTRPDVQGAPAAGRPAVARP
jgi:sugar/nucleoside kinase (ribokinase family)